MHDFSTINTKVQANNHYRMEPKKSRDHPSLKIEGSSKLEL